MRAVTSTIIGVLLIGLATTAIAPPATAEIRTLTGTITGNPGSKLIIKVQRVGGHPFRIKSFRFQRVAFRCSGSTPDGLVDGTVGVMKVRKDVNPFDPVSRTNVYFSRSDQLTVDGRIGVFITGIVDRKAKRTRGNIGLSFGNGCSADNGTGFSPFTAKG